MPVYHSKDFMVAEEHKSSWLLRDQDISTKASTSAANSLTLNCQTACFPGSIVVISYMSSSAFPSRGPYSTLRNEAPAGIACSTALGWSEESLVVWLLDAALHIL